jgi:hypothetical protein
VNKDYALERAFCRLPQKNAEVSLGVRRKAFNRKVAKQAPLRSLSGRKDREGAQKSEGFLRVDCGYLLCGLCGYGLFP